MCGITAVFGSRLDGDALRKMLIECSKLQRHRGPDWSGYKVIDHNGLAHERLAIIDPESGSQPLTTADDTVALILNGEIYNYQEIYASLEQPYEPRTGSDSEAVLPLYERFSPLTFLNKLRGMFAFVLYDAKNNTYMAARDHVGIIPLYIGWAVDGSVWFSSEMKVVEKTCARFQQFQPGHYYTSETPGVFHRWHKPKWCIQKTLPTTTVDLATLREKLTTAVRRVMMSDVPWGVLLSGGLDSSLVASIASRLRDTMARERSDEGKSWFEGMQTFSIGLEGSPDLAAAQKVADFLGSKHHNYTFTIQEGLDAIRDVIYHVETYDVTTIRASTPMFLMSRKIKSMGVKMVLSGEGADEMFGGYLYFHAAPDSTEFFHETVDKVKALYKFDCLRANKSTSAWGVEARVPFLDVDFLDYVMELDPAQKMIDKKSGRIEKYILRKAFDTPEDPYLPNDILWRQKEQFSDGVGYGWIDSLRAAAEAEVTDDMMAAAHLLFPKNTPSTKEAYRYRAIFEELFPKPAAAETVPGGKSIACSTERAMQWSAEFAKRADCSGRSVAGVHEAAYDHTFVAEKRTDASQPPLKKSK